MTTNQDDALTPEEFASLGQLAKGPLATEVPADHAERLSNLGFIAKIRGEYVLTETGLRQLEDFQRRSFPSTL